MGAAGCVGPAGVTLQLALARGARGCSEVLRELNLAHRRTRAPRLLGTGRRNRWCDSTGGVAPRCGARSACERRGTEASALHASSLHPLGDALRGVVGAKLATELTGELSSQADFIQRFFQREALLPAI